MKRSTDPVGWSSCGTRALRRAAAWVFAAGCVGVGLGHASAAPQEPSTPPAEPVATPVAPAAAKPNLFVQGARVLTGRGEELADADIAISGGRIRGVGDFQPPANSAAKVIDARGLTIVPGFVDAASDLLLEAEARAGRTGGSELELALSVDPFDDRPRLTALAAGVTSMALARAAQTAEQGLSAVRKLAYPPREAHAAVGGSALHLRIGLGRDRASKERDLRGLSSLFEGAEKYHGELEKYAKELKEYEEKKAEYDKKVAKEREKEKDKPEAEKSASKEKEPKKPREPKEDLGKAAVFRALQGELPVVLHVEDELDVENALELRRKFGLKLSLRGLSRARAAVDSIAKAGVPVLLEIDAVLPNRELTRTPAVARDLAKAFAEAGVDVAYVSGSRGRELAPHLLDLAAEAVSRGVSRASALRAITYGPARALGLERKIGSIAEGCDADLVAYDGDPFSSAARVRWVMVDGEIVYAADRIEGSAQR
ncbi:MAG: amidohydrolase family protein [Planctomycetes bacterium]|nr:amidohydrolase family protein [Planctomycetota bacterium]